MSVLAVFDISKAKDEFGNEIEINNEYTTFGMLTYVSLLSLPCEIRTYVAKPKVIRNLSNVQLHLDLPLLKNWLRT